MAASNNQTTKKKSVQNSNNCNKITVKVNKMSEVSASELVSCHPMPCQKRMLGHGTKVGQAFRLDWGHERDRVETDDQNPKANLMSPRISD